jgi:RNA polymerase sporulation-specific sigma factor
MTEKLKPKETLEYIKLAQDGDKEARDKAVEGNMQLVHYICNKYYSNSPHYEDLIQVGAMGLIEVVDKFDPSRGFQFSTYAGKTIHGKMQNFMRNGAADVVRLPPLDRRVATHIIRDGLWDKSPEELFEMLVDKIPKLNLNNCIGGKSYLTKPVASLDVPFSVDDPDMTLGDILVGDINPKDWFEEFEIRDLIERALTQKQLDVVEPLLFEDLNNSEIGKKLGYSRGYVRYMLHDIRKALKYYLEKGERLVKESKKRNKPEVKTGRAPNGDKKKAVRLMKTTDMSLLEIRKQTGISDYIAKKLERMYRLEDNTESSGTLRMTEDMGPTAMAEAFTAAQQKQGTTIPKTDSPKDYIIDEDKGEWVKRPDVVATAVIKPSAKPEHTITANSIEVDPDKVMLVGATAPNPALRTGQTGMSFNMSMAGEEAAKAEVVQKLKSMITVLETIETDNITFNVSVGTKG